jgi:lipid A 3-O-deacylase
VAPAALAQDQQPRAVALTFQIDNDWFTNADYHYTNGLRFSYMPANPWPIVDRLADVVLAPPTWIAGVARDAERRISYILGQSMFTPNNINDDQLIVEERPYAAWLYGGVALHRVSRRTLDTAELDIGIVGPSALGRPVQTEWHEAIGVGKPQGWDNQLNDEPAVLLTFERKIRHGSDAALRNPALSMDWLTSFGAALGNVYILADAGALVRIGQRMPPDFGPPRIKPTLSGADWAPYLAPGEFAWYAFAGANVRAVARDIFLDGNTFKPSHHVDSKPFVTELQAGLAAFYGPVRLTYSFVYRSREYSEQDGADRFGGLSATLRF